jgi:HrpA-like RNA helicase
MSMMGSPQGRAKFFKDQGHRMQSGLSSGGRHDQAPYHTPRQKGGGAPSLDIIPTKKSGGSAVVVKGNAGTPELDTSTGLGVDKAKSTEIEDDRLPVEKYKDRFLRALENSDIVIVTAETGAGKSTMIPQYAKEAGYKVTVTQPRRLAASSLATYVAEQQETELGDKVGFRHALEKLVSADSDIVFETDGFRFATENISKHKYSGHPQEELDQEVIVLDEVHEYNKYMESILALMKLRRDQERPVPKIVIMSATINAQEISDFFGGDVPILDVPGRTYPVEMMAPGASIQADVSTLVEAQKNTLVFLPGKGEIAEMEMLVRRELAAKGLDAEIVPLHSKLSRQEQELAFKSYGKPKIVLSTDVAQTSLTIPDIDAVVMSGVVRNKVSREGERGEVLEIQNFSKFDHDQQAGRAGRTKFGIAINHGTPYQDLPDEPGSEIQTTKLDGLVLRLLAGGEVNTQDQFERIEFLHQPPQWLVNDAFRSLRELGLVGPQGHITATGREVARLPVDVRTGKMLVTAEDMSLNLRDPEILLQAIDAAAVIESEGVGIPRKSRKWQKFCKGEYESDVFAQVAVFRKALEMEPDRFNKFGIDPTGLRRARDMRGMLYDRFGISDDLKPSDEPSHEQRDRVRESIAAGFIDSVYKLMSAKDDSRIQYKHISGPDFRMLGKSSMIDHASLVAGKAFDIMVFNDNGYDIVNLLVMGTEVRPDWLKRHRVAEMKRDVDDTLRQLKRDERPTRKGSRGYRNNPPRRN